MVETWLLLCPADRFTIFLWGGVDEQIGAASHSKAGGRRHQIGRGIGCFSGPSRIDRWRAEGGEDEDRKSPLAASGSSTVLLAVSHEKRKVRFAVAAPLWVELVFISPLAWGDRGRRIKMAS